MDHRHLTESEPTTRDWVWGQIADAVEHPAENVVWDEAPDDDPLTLIEAVEWARRIEAAAAALRRHMGAEYHARYDRKAFRYGDLVYRYSARANEACIDEDGFWEAFDAAGIDPAQAFNPNAVRRSALSQAMRDTFFEKRWAEPTLEARPINDPKLPAFLRDIQPGELR